MNSFIQWNSCGLRTNFTDFRLLCDKYNPIICCLQTSPGIDTVHYQLLRHLPEDSLLLLLYIFNHIWLTQDLPVSWKTAIIIPVPKPGKVLSDHGSYWPIALTSCLCKTMERTVNSRLI